MGKWIFLHFWSCLCVLFSSITESFKSSWFLILLGSEILFLWYLLTLSCKLKRKTFASIFSLSQAQHKPSSDATERFWKTRPGNGSRFPAFLWIYEDIKLHKWETVKNETLERFWKVGEELYESGGKKRHCSQTADQTGENQDLQVSQNW